MRNKLVEPARSDFLLRLSTCENHPTVKRIRSAFTASAGSYPKIGGSSFDHIAKSDLLVGNKSRQSYSVRRVFTFILGGHCFRFPLSCYSPPRIRCQQNLIGRRGVQQRWNYRGSPQCSRLDNGEFDL